MTEFRENIDFKGMHENNLFRGLALIKHPAQILAQGLAFFVVSGRTRRR